MCVRACLHFRPLWLYYCILALSLLESSHQLPLSSTRLPIVARLNTYQFRAVSSVEVPTPHFCMLPLQVVNVTPSSWRATCKPSTAPHTICSPQ